MLQCINVSLKWLHVNAYAAIWLVIVHIHIDIHINTLVCPASVNMKHNISYLNFSLVGLLISFW